MSHHIVLTMAEACVQFYAGVTVWPPNSGGFKRIRIKFM
jgi:hypothetical protein